MTIAQSYRQEGRLEGIQIGIEQGIKRGVVRGVEEGKLEMVKSLLRDGIDKKTISKASSFSLDEIIKIERELKKTN